MTKTSKISMFIRTGLLSLVFLYLLVLVYRASNTVTFQTDEVSWFFHTEFFEQLFIKGDMRSDTWTSYESYDHPQLSKYLYGVFLWIRRPDVFVERDALRQIYGRWNIYSNKTLDIHQTKFASYIRDMRYMNAFFVLCALIVIWALCVLLTNSWFLSLFVPLALVNNELFMTPMIRATPDAQVTFFIFSAVLTYLYYIRSQKLWLLGLFTFLSAMAISSKLSGVVVLFTYMLFTVVNVLIFPKMKKIFIHHSVWIVVGTVWLWYIVNPTLYMHPIENTIRYFSFRNEVSTMLAVNYPEQALPLWTQKIQAFACTLIITSCSNVYSKGALFSYSLVNIITIIIGFTYTVVRGFKKQRNNVFIFWACFSYIILAATIFYLPLNFDRYYISMQVTIYIAQLLGLKCLIDAGIAWITKSRFALLQN